MQSIDSNDVQLEETYFYAESGGQPDDRGTLNSIEVSDIRSTNGETVHALETVVDQLRQQLIQERLKSLVDDSVSKHGHEWVIGELEIDGIGSNDVSEHVQSLAGDIGDVVALTGASDDPFVVVGSTGDPDASEIVDDLTATFDGGGSGGPAFA